EVCLPISRGSELGLARGPVEVRVIAAPCGRPSTYHWALSAVPSTTRLTVTPLAALARVWIFAPTVGIWMSDGAPPQTRTRSSWPATPPVKHRKLPMPLKKYEVDGGT